MHPAFTLQQHAVMSLWSRARPLGLRIEIELDHEDYLEMAAVVPHRSQDSIYRMFATDDGCVVLGETWGSGEETFFEIADALARVMELELAVVSVCA